MNAIEIEKYLYFIRGNKWNRQTINEKTTISRFHVFAIRMQTTNSIKKRKEISDETKRMLILGCFDVFFSFCVLFMLSPFRDYFGIGVPKPNSFCMQNSLNWICTHVRKLSLLLLQMKRTVETVRKYCRFSFFFPNFINNNNKYTIYCNLRKDKKKKETL